MGSPGYMSPEQLRSTRDVDGRTDVWALGAILYELVSGRAAFDGETVADVYIKVATEPLPPLGVEGLPDGFEDVVKRCLEKDADARYQSVAEMAWALAPFAGPLGSIAAERVARCLGAAASAALTPMAMAKAARPTDPGSSEGTTRGDSPGARGTKARWGWRSARTLVTLAGALVVVVVAIALGFGGGGTSAPPAASSSPDAAPADMDEERDNAFASQDAGQARPALVEADSEESLSVAADARTSDGQVPGKSPSAEPRKKTGTGSHRPPKTGRHQPAKTDSTKPAAKTDSTGPARDPYRDF